MKKTNKQQHRKDGSVQLADLEARYSRLLFNRPEDFIKENNVVIDDDSKETKAKWLDEDDEVYTAGQILKNENPDKYTNELKRKYKNLLGTPSWAQLSKKIRRESSNSEDDNQVLQTVGHLAAIQPTVLKKELLEVKRFPQINKDGDEGPIIKIIEFHPTSSVAMIAGNSVMSIYSIGGDQNNKLHSIRIPDFKFLAARFMPDGNHALLIGSNVKNYYIYDLLKAETTKCSLPPHMNSPKVFEVSPCGQFLAISEGFNEICLISALSKELLHKFNQSSNVKSLCFNYDSTKLYSFAENGTVLIYDLLKKRIMNKFADSGCITGSIITESPCGKYLATGSCEGIVNLYKTDELNTAEPIPFKTISNLTTKITALKFNFSSEILGISSSYLPNAIKLFHMQSETIFKNFPEPASKFHQVQTFNFSPHGGYLGLVNNKHKAYLYRLKHYYNY